MREWGFLMERHRVVYSGRVQGVGFRATASGVARGYEVTGWVRNEDDGTVVMEVQGETGEVDRYLAELRERMAGYVRGEDVVVVGVVGGEEGVGVRG